jgi:hypothetical protein
LRESALDARPVEAAVLADPYAGQPALSGVEVDRLRGDASKELAADFGGGQEREGEGFGEVEAELVLHGL